ncbi:MAG: septal ring lytic transglycosylase RlpA family protein [Caulobacteraceae bacterium]|nr:septal ring lytic transglycosylase RlpA family protein [Caulobacteraceae bacterium]
MRAGSLKGVIRAAAVAAATATLAACASVPGMGGAGRPRVPVVTDPAPIVPGTMRPYQVRGRWYRPMSDARGYDETGLASWYGDQFNGRATSTGERFDMHALSAAHKTLPLPALVEVTNEANGRSIVVRVNDRGPFVDNRIIDLSRGAAEELDLLSRGVGQVRVRYLGPAPRGGGTGIGAGWQIASNDRPAPAPPREPADRYWVQAGSFSDATLAHLAAESLGSRASVNTASVDGQRYFRVLVGPWDDANAAERERQSIVARGVRDALLVSGR